MILRPMAAAMEGAPGGKGRTSRLRSAIRLRHISQMLHAPEATAAAASSAASAATAAPTASPTANSAAWNIISLWWDYR